MTNDEFLFDAQQLWTTAFRDLSDTRVLNVWYSEHIAQEVKDSIEMQLGSEIGSGLDESSTARLTKIAATLGQFLENEKVWFAAMLADMKAENAARLAEQNS